MDYTIIALPILKAIWSIVPSSKTLIKNVVGAIILNQIARKLKTGIKTVNWVNKKKIVLKPKTLILIASWQMEPLWTLVPSIRTLSKIVNCPMVPKRIV